MKKLALVIAMASLSGCALEEIRDRETQVGRTIAPHCIYGYAYPCWGARKDTSTIPRVSPMREGGTAPSQQRVRVFTDTGEYLYTQDLRDGRIYDRNGRFIGQQK